MNIISNWKTYLKFLSRNKGYTAIDLFGLSVSLMFVLLPSIHGKSCLRISSKRRKTGFIWSAKKCNL